MQKLVRWLTAFLAHSYYFEAFTDHSSFVQVYLLRFEMAKLPDLFCTRVSPGPLQTPELIYGGAQLS